MKQHYQMIMVIGKLDLKDMRLAHFQMFIIKNQKVLMCKSSVWENDTEIASAIVSIEASTPSMPTTHIQQLV